MRHRNRPYDSALPRVTLSKALGFVLVAGIVTGGVVKNPLANPGIARAQSAAGQLQRFVSVLDDDRPVLGLGVGKLRRRGGRRAPRGPTRRAGCGAIRSGHPRR